MHAQQRRALSLYWMFATECVKDKVTQEYQVKWTFEICEI